MVITVLIFFCSPLLPYAWSYILISLPFMASSFITLRFLLDNICISTRSLVVRTYFWRVPIYYYRMWQYNVVNYHIYRVLSQLFPEVSMLVHIYEIQLHYKIIFLISLLPLYSFCCYVLSIMYHLLSCIYLLVLLVNILQIFIDFYYINILIPKIRFNFSNSFTFHNCFTEERKLGHWIPVNL